MTEKAGLVVPTTVRVRYGETDQMGVVYHAAYVVYCEIGRTEFMRVAGLPYAEMERRGFLFVVADLSLKLRDSARYDEELTVLTRLVRIRHTSIVFGYEIRAAADGRLLTTGETRLGCLDAQTKKVTPIPSDFFEKMAACQAVAE